MLRMSGPVYRSIHEKLSIALKPIRLEIVDQSSSHVGHVGMKGETPIETHFAVNVVSDMFTGKSAVVRHQMVYKLLQQELKNSVHALSLSTKTPLEVEMDSIGKSSQ